MLRKIFHAFPEGRIKNLLRTTHYSLSSGNHFTIKYVLAKDQWRVEYEGVKLLFWKNPYDVLKYNHHFLAHFPSWAPDLIVDAGAFYGTIGLYLAKKYPASKVYLLEPDPETFEILKKNKELNNLTNAVLIKKGLWNRNETLRFVNGQDVSSTIAREDAPGTIAIETISPETLLDNCTGKKIFFKMNIEGAEIESLSASISLWQNNQVQFAIATDHIVNNELTVKSIESICSNNNMPHHSEKEMGCITTYIEARP